MRSSLPTPAALAAILSVTIAAVSAEGPEAGAPKLAARASIDTSCYTNPDWQSCNGRLTEGPLCVTMTDRASATACACTSLSIEIECYSSYCPSALWTPLTPNLVACTSSLGDSGGSSSATTTSAGAANTGSATTTSPGATGGAGGSQATGAAASTSKNAASMTATSIGGERVFATLFALAWAVGLAGFMI